MTEKESDKKEVFHNEDYISKFQINELIPLLRLCGKHRIDIREGKKFLGEALHTARTTRDMEKIVQSLEGGKREIEHSLDKFFFKWYLTIKTDMKGKNELIRPESPLRHLMETTRILIADKDYERVETLLGRCELELLRLVSAPSPPAIKPQQSVSRSPIESNLKMQQSPLEPPPEWRERIKKSTAYKKLKVEEVVKCGICVGKIKLGLMAIECVCGIYYHEQCAKRSGKCLNCGANFAE
jgi:hypothetical protein